MGYRLRGFVEKNAREYHTLNLNHQLDSVINVKARVDG